MSLCSTLPWHLWPWHIFRSPVSIHARWAQDAADHKWKQTQQSAAVHQARLSDNRWDVECLPGLSTQEGVCRCIRAPHRALCLMMDPSWRGIAIALWNMLEDDYNREWLSLSLSSVCARPLPLPPPLFYFSLLLSLLPFSTRGQVSLLLRCQGCQSPTQWVRGNCCQGNSDSVARHLELCSQ